MGIADEIGALKKSNNIAILQAKRWNEILGKMILKGQEHTLSEAFILKIYKAISDNTAEISLLITRSAR